MAEERLIDDDLNRHKKYRIRKNADGEEELYIDESPDEESEDLEAVSFDVPEFSGNDEELTPEQIASAEQEKRERAERIRGALSVNLEKAQAKIAGGDFESALADVENAAEIDPSCGEVWFLKLKALTKNLTDFGSLDDCVDAAANVSRCCTERQKEMLAEMSAPLENKVNKLEEHAAELHVEVERQKSERRAVFAEDKRKSFKAFTLTALPFLVFLVLAISFATVMFADKNGVFLIITIVFAALAAAFLIATFVTGHKLWDAMKKLSLNEKNSSTKLGREYEETISNVKKLNTVLQSFKEV